MCLCVCVCVCVCVWRVYDGCGDVFVWLFGFESGHSLVESVGGIEML